MMVKYSRSPQVLSIRSDYKILPQFFEKTKAFLLAFVYVLGPSLTGEVTVVGNPLTLESETYSTEGVTTFHIALTPMNHHKSEKYAFVLILRVHCGS